MSMLLKKDLELIHKLLCEYDTYLFHHQPKKNHKNFNFIQARWGEERKSLLELTEKLEIEIEEIEE